VDQDQREDETMNKHIVATMAFYAKYPGWHSIADDTNTKRAVSWLKSEGFLETNSFNQARHTGKVFAS
jgi:hypothetical protein